MHKCGKLCKSGNILKVKIERDSYLGYSSFAKLVLFLGLKQKLVFLKGVIFLGFIAGRIHVG